VVRDVSRCPVACLLLWHDEQGGTPGAMGPVRLVPGAILGVGDVRMGLEYPP
jgi:hypothetical protein